MIELRLVETEADVEAFLDVRRRVDPENPITRENFDGGRADADRLDLLAVLDGETVGAAWAHFPGFDRDSHYLYVSVRVVREGRRRGAGGALFRRVSEHARVHGRSALYTVTRHDDDDSLGYLGRRGFVELGRMEDVTLVLEDTAAVIDPPQGIEIVPLGSRGELERCMYEVALEADADIPSSEPVVSGAFEDWRKRNLEPRVLRNLSFVALEDGKVVGFATLGSDGPDVAQHFMTGSHAGPADAGSRPPSRRRRSRARGRPGSASCGHKTTSATRRCGESTRSSATGGGWRGSTSAARSSIGTREPPPARRLLQAGERAHRQTRQRADRDCQQCQRDEVDHGSFLVVVTIFLQEYRSKPHYLLQTREVSVRIP